MPYEIVIPRLGLTMETGTLADWFRGEGEAVTKGELLFSVETDKALQEVEAPVDGIVYHRPDVLGIALPVGTLIGFIGQPGESISWPEEAVHAGDGAEVSPDSLGRVPISASPPPTTSELRRASPAARRRAKEAGIDWRSIPGSNRDGYVQLADVEQAAAVARQPLADSKGKISPVARRAATELGVEIEALAAQHPARRLTREDVERAAEEQRESGLVGRRQPMTSIRRVIAERMSSSAHTTAPVTLTSEVDATKLVRWREHLKEHPEASATLVPSYTDILSKLTVEALLEHPELNTRLEGEEIVTLDSIHIGIAVDTDRGLIAPVIRDAQSKSLREIAAEAADLFERARAGRIGPDEASGSTFTVTNLGMYDIDAFTPIINPIECAILGVGRIVPKQVVLDWKSERMAIRHMMILSLTFDHRLVDGGPAARFLQRVKQYVEEPNALLTT